MCVKSSRVTFALEMVEQDSLGSVEARVLAILRADGRAGSDVRIVLARHSDAAKRAACRRDAAVRFTGTEVTLMLAYFVATILAIVMCLPSYLAEASALRQLVDEAESYVYAVIIESGGDMAFVTVDVAAQIVVAYHASEGVGNRTGFVLEIDNSLFESSVVMIHKVTTTHKMILIVRPKEYAKPTNDADCLGAKQCWISCGPLWTPKIRDISPGPHQFIHQAWFVSTEDIDAIDANVMQPHGWGGERTPPHPTAPMSRSTDPTKEDAKLAVAVPAAAGQRV